MNIKVILTLVATVIWFGIGWRYYTCNIKNFCGDDSPALTQVENNGTEDESEPAKDEESSQYPLAFEWGKSSPITGADFDAFKQDLLSQAEGGKSLTITGQFFENENDPQLGIERAKQLRLMLADVLDTNRIFISEASLAADSSMEGRMFEGALFAWSAPEESIIERIGNELTFYFPYKSTERISDTEVEKVFEDLVKEIQDKGRKVSLTGHTDDIGPDDYNKDLGLRRATAIKQLLEQKGLASNNITISSKGESMPTGDNTTDAGRKKNRRVVIQIQ